MTTVSSETDEVPTQPPEAGTAENPRLAILLAMAMFVLVVDTSIMNVSISSVVRDLGMPEDRVNVNGGAIALGHPLGATGSKLTTQLVHELGRRGGGIGLVTMCIGGGMGAAGLFEVYPS